MVDALHGFGFFNATIQRNPWTTVKVHIITVAHVLRENVMGK